jgi:hypothetical protein
MNPLVAPHLEFLPEDARGLNIYKLLQSTKWLKHFESDLQVQMVESNQKHFYLFEPVQLKSLEIIIPVYFYSQNGALFAKVYKPVLKSNSDHSTLEIHAAINPSSISYDHLTLQTISVNEFYQTYCEITLKNDLKLHDCCGDKIICENFRSTSLI